MIKGLLCVALMAARANSQTTTDEQIAALKAMLVQQQQQIDELRAALNARNHAAPPPPSIAAPVPVQAETVRDETPLRWKIGSTSITPIGFMEFTGLYRSTNPGSGTGTTFANVPYNNAVNGNVGEFRLSGQNSRLGLRADATVRGVDVLGYMESDFLGYAPANLAVTGNSDTLRMRLFFVDVRRDSLEVLAGQSWSLLTPNRRGLSPLPGDLFYGLGVDANYLAGLPWSRNAQFRVAVHPSEKFAAGVSFENPEQYIGGSGTGTVTLPGSVSTSYAKQLDDGTTTLAAPNAHPDIVAKIAYDPASRMHVEAAGLFRSFRVYNPAAGHDFTANGFGGSFNANFEILKNVRLFSNNFLSDGGGRYLMGMAPDLVVRADGSLSALRSGSSVDGIEIATKRTVFFAYYGGTFIGKNVVADSGGKFAGYGYSGSPNSQNRTIQEPTLGVTRTFWKDPKYGALQMSAQYAYVLRYPWYLAAGAPRDAHAGMMFMNLRYVLPGAPPPVER